MGIRRILGRSFMTAVVAGAGLYAGKVYVDADHTGVALVPPSGPPVVQKAPPVWAKAQADLNAAKAAFITDNQIAFDWFADFPFSQTDGTPLIIMRLLPLLAPDQWKGGEALLSEVGLFMDPRNGIEFFPRGVGFTGLSPDADPKALDLTSFTCGACHIGRVNAPDGATTYIDGAINTTFNINKYYSETYKTLQTIYAGETERDAQITKLTNAVLAALDTAEATSPTFFYLGYKNGWRTYDAAYEAKQIALFRSDPEKYVRMFADYTEGFVAAFSTYLDKEYDGFQSQMLAGFPGMADATGVSSSHGYQALSGKIGGTLAKVILPDAPGLTDYMAVWEQDTRAAEWDPTGKQLINGGGQYNGNIPIPVFRNLAAATTMGLDNPDIRVPAFAAQLLGGLPATPYPFAVDDGLAQKGEALFAENCAGCHQPHNGAVYDNLGTDPSRSKVISTVLMIAARRGYATFCPPTLELDLAGKKVKPCAEYEGVSLKGFSTAIMRPLNNQFGYNATALRGIWAVAPYLHTGSVPTMRHLLMPDTRPDTFVRGLLDYDTQNMGFAWEGEGGTVFDTTAFHALTKSGHDTDIIEGDKTYKLDWSDDPAGVDALIEYLKTL